MTAIDFPLNHRYIFDYCEEKPKDIFNIFKVVAEWASEFFDSFGAKQVSLWSKHAKSAFAFPSVVIDGNAFRKGLSSCAKKIQAWWEGREEPSVSLREELRCLSVDGAKIGKDVCEIAKFGSKIEAFSINAFAAEFFKNIFGVYSSVNSLADVGNKYVREQNVAQNVTEIERAINHREKQLTRAEIVKNSFSIVGEGFAFVGLITGVAMNSLVLLSISTVILIASIASFLLKADIQEKRHLPA